MKEEKEKKTKKDKVNEEVAKLTSEKLELSDKVLRLNAEIQNMARRFNEERANIYKYDGEELIKKLLPVVDNFERAISLETLDLNDDTAKFLSGFKMIYVNFIDILKSYGVTEIEAKGKEFDPNEMQAIMTEHIEGLDSNTVIEVLQKGYKYNDKILRVAMVKVSE